jgi:hypothetical protein
MAKKLYTSWVCEDGSFGTGTLIIFDYDDLTDFEWDQLDDAPDSKKLMYVEAALLNPSLRSVLGEDYQWNGEDQ